MSPMWGGLHRQLCSCPGLLAVCPLSRSIGSTVRNVRGTLCAAANKMVRRLRIVLLSPTIATEELAAVLKINRRQTARNMVKRIRAAKYSQDSSATLTGLDELYLGFG